MKVVMSGNIAAKVAAHIAESFDGVVEEDVLKGIVKEVLPDNGLVLKCDTPTIDDFKAVLDEDRSDNIVK